MRGRMALVLPCAGWSAALAIVIRHLVAG